MDLVVVVGCSAVGKRTLMAALVEPSSLARESLGIAIHAVVGATGGEFKWPYGALGDVEALLKTAEAAGVSVLVLKHQFCYSEQEIARLAQTIVSKGGQAKFIMLWLPGAEHAGRYYRKYKDCDRLRANGDAVLKFLDVGDMSGAAAFLSQQTRQCHKDFVALIGGWQGRGVDVALEIRQAEHPYALIDETDL